MTEKKELYKKRRRGGGGGGESRRRRRDESSDEDDGDDAIERWRESSRGEIQQPKSDEGNKFLSDVANMSDYGDMCR